MMKRDECELRETISRWDDLELSGDRQKEVRTHLNECGFCRDALLQMRGVRFSLEKEEGGDLPDGFWEKVQREVSVASDPGMAERVIGRIGERKRKGGIRSRSGSSWRGWGIAAALVLSVSIPAWILSTGDGMPEGKTSELEQGASVRAFADGGKVRFSSDAVVAWEREDARRNLRLEAGSLEIDVPEGARRFRISTPSGEFEDVGTRFRLRVFPALPGELRSVLSPLTLCEVEEGIVLTRNEGGELPVSRGNLAFLWKEAAPRGQVSASGSGGKSGTANSLAVFFEAWKKGDRETLRRQIEQWVLDGEKAIPVFETALREEGSDETRRKRLSVLLQWFRRVVSQTEGERNG